MGTDPGRGEWHRDRNRLWTRGHSPSDQHWAGDWCWTRGLARGWEPALSWGPEVTLPVLGTGLGPASVWGLSLAQGSLCPGTSTGMGTVPSPGVTHAGTSLSQALTLAHGVEKNKPPHTPNNPLAQLGTPREILPFREEVKLRQAKIARKGIFFFF